MKKGNEKIRNKKARQNKRTVGTILIAIAAVSVLICVLVAETLNLGYTARERRDLYERTRNK